jgi:hypothetical protein
MPSAASSFRNLHCNQPVEKEARFLNSTDWDACNAAADAEDLRERTCWAGLEAGAHDVVCYFWVPISDRLPPGSRSSPRSSTSAGSPSIAGGSRT